MIVVCPPLVYDTLHCCVVLSVGLLSAQLLVNVSPGMLNLCLCRQVVTYGVSPVTTNTQCTPSRVSTHCLVGDHMTG